MPGEDTDLSRGNALYEAANEPPSAGFCASVVTPLRASFIAAITRGG
jgi:hypothetical protein